MLNPNSKRFQRLNARRQALITQAQRTPEETEELDRLTVQLRKAVAHNYPWKTIDEMLLQALARNPRNPMTNETAPPLLEVARIAHEVNRAYCEAMADHSQPTWENAPDWQKDSALAGVAAIVTKPDTTPQESHESWMRQKILDGWRYGPEKDSEMKTHPCMVPYDLLPMHQQVKDHLFGAVVRAMRKL